MTLAAEIEENRKTIRTDGYPMSIGELANLYRDGELDVHPEFQRVFRWSDEQKSALIESILLGIPLPSFFVAQDDTGNWDVVDGVQRLSTILQFMGLFKNDEGELQPPLRLRSTKFLPSLDGTFFENRSAPETSLESAYRIDFKRAKVDLKILQRGSDPTTKYELFQRLNSLGSPLSDQERRSCLMISLDRDQYYWLKSLADDDSFRAAISIPDHDIDKQFHMELALRFILLHDIDTTKLRRINTLSEFLDDLTVDMLADKSIDYTVIEKRFKRTFEIISSSLGENAFRKYKDAEKAFSGPFSVTAFEVVALGLGWAISQNIAPPNDAELREIVVNGFWGHDEFRAGYSTGVRADTRMRKTLPFGREIQNR